MNFSKGQMEAEKMIQTASDHWRGRIIGRVVPLKTFDNESLHEPELV